MIKRSTIIFLIMAIMYSNPAYAVGFSAADLFAEEGSSATDAKTFVNRALAMEIQSSNIMVACFDFSNPNCDESPTYDECFAASQQDFDDCEAYDSWLTGMGYTTDSVPEAQNMLVSSEINTCADARYYKNCDGLGGGNLYGVTEKQYLVFYKKKYDCDAGSPSWYTYDAEGYVSPYDYDYNDEISCPAFKKCSEDDDDSYVTTYNGAITNPCRTDDGSTSDYACDVNSDCWSNNCGGSKTELRYQCVTDGGSSYRDQYKPWFDTCGGSGYGGSWTTETTPSCSSGYVCDGDHDEQVVTSPSTPPSACRKNIGESCSVTTDCWNDDGGNWCNSISDCTDGANGRGCGSDSDCNSGRCDSTCVAKLADGNSCDENSDCINSNCISGICGGLKCDGTIEVLTEDNSGSPLSSLSVYLNGTFNGSTTSIGQKVIDFGNVECGATQEITVKCSDNTTVCGTKSAQIDINGDTDYLSFDCTKCSSTNDLYISQSDVFVYVNDKIVNATVHSTGITSSVTVALYRQDENGVIDSGNILSDTISVTAGSEKNATFSLSTLKDTDFLHIYIDSNNTVTNEDETNNYIFRAATKPVKAYIDVKTQSSFLDDLIKEYVATFVESVSLAKADIVIIVGHPTASGSDQSFNLQQGIRLSTGKGAGEHYEGIVKRGSFPNSYSGKPEVLAYGNGIEGTLAAVKRMINARNIFLEKNSGDYTSYIDRYDTLGISVMDLLHNSETRTYFNKNTTAFKETVRKVLFDNNFEVAVKPVMTRETTSYGENTTLRVKNVNSDFSADYKDAVGISDKPVVLSRGIHSNLFSWQDFGQELAADGQDVWLIEMVGGPNTDDTSDDGCGSSCPDYTFGDLKDYYWPALIAGVQEYTGKNKIDYVGFSLGCSAALESLKSHQNGENNIGYYFDYSTGRYLFSDLTADPVDTFVGMGCPGNFTQLTTFMKVFDITKDNVFLLAGLLNADHLKGRDLRRLTYPFRFNVLVQDPVLYARPYWASLYLSGFVPVSDKKMSINIYDEFYNWVNDPSKPDLGNGVQLNNTLLIQGKATGLLSPLSSGILVPSSVDKASDLIVLNEDMKILCDNINSTNKYYASFDRRTHGGFGTNLPDSKTVQALIKKFLTSKSVAQNPDYMSNNKNDCTLI